MRKTLSGGLWTVSRTLLHALSRQSWLRPPRLPSSLTETAAASSRSVYLVSRPRPRRSWAWGKEPQSVWGKHAEDTHFLKNDIMDPCGILICRASLEMLSKLSKRPLWLTTVLKTDSLIVLVQDCMYKDYYMLLGQNCPVKNCTLGNPQASTRALSNKESSYNSLSNNKMTFWC